MRPISSKEKSKVRNILFIAITLGLFVSSVLLLYKKNLIISVITFFITFSATLAYSYFRRRFQESGRIKIMEAVFPDFLQLMSSNLRAGMTIDKSILLSSRPEFAPLDEEILKTGKDIATSRDLERALLDLSKRINSEKINKIIILIISGLKSGGDLAVLLEETSVNMREREFLEKKAASNVLMYIIFIFLVVSIFAPALFSLSNVLVEVLSKILGSVPQTDTTGISLPFGTLSKISVSMDFINYFSIAFIVTIDLLACFVLGLVSKGEQKEGLKYFPIILVMSLGIFFVVKIFLLRFMMGII
jgi:archaellum biogenesis protein FlaJ (TadC family)